MLAEYTVLWLCSPPAIKQIHARAKKAVAQASVNQSDIATLELPLPPRDEQADIVASVEDAVQRGKREQTTLAKLTNLKGHLADGLLRGQVRVKVAAGIAGGPLS